MDHSRQGTVDILKPGSFVLASSRVLWWQPNRDEADDFCPSVLFVKEQYPSPFRKHVPRHKRVPKITILSYKLKGEYGQPIVCVSLGRATEALCLQTDNLYTYKVVSSPPPRNPRTPQKGDYCCFGKTKTRFTQMNESLSSIGISSPVSLSVFLQIWFSMT